jgi:hypothetical protein
LTAIEAISAAVQLIKQFRSGDRTPTSEEQDLLDRAVAAADKAAKIADAQTAKALGYTLCHCLGGYGGGGMMISLGGGFAGSGGFSYHR